MTDDQVIDEILKELGKKDQHGFRLDRYILLKFPSHKSDKHRIADIILSNDLAKPSSEPDKCVITQFGRDVNEQGGWVKYRKLEKEKRQKFKHDAILSKWKVYTFWPMLVVSFISGIAALSLELQDRYTRWQKEQSSTEKAEVSANSIDMTKSLAQYPNLDTLK